MKPGLFEHYFKTIWYNSPSSLMKAIGAKLPGRGKQNLGSARRFSMEGESVFAEFERDDGQRISLYEGYRDRIKARWRSFDWPTRALVTVGSRLQLDSDATTLIQALQSGRTLPAHWNEFADVVEKLADRHPAEFVRSDILCPWLKRPIIVARLSDSHLEAIAQVYRNQATLTLQTFRQGSSADIPVESLAVLETGCGMGYAVMAMANLGVGHAVGIDSIATNSRCIHQKPAVSARMGMGDAAISNRVRILTGDIAQMPLEDNSFDLIYSASVLEHIQDLPKALAEMLRILKPGGLMIHNVDPYFSPQGGHSLCTLDFPWGHTRLNSNEFQRYIKEFRPFEAEYAIDFYQNCFNHPRISFHEIEQTISKVGLDILSWQETWKTDHLPSSKIWQEVSQIYPYVAIRDLSSSDLHIILTKR